MKAKGVEALLTWYGRVKQEGLPVVVAQSPLGERVATSRRLTQDLRLGEMAWRIKRLDDLLRPLSAAQRALLFALPPAEARARNAFYKRRLRLVNALRSAILDAGLLTND